MPAGAVPGRPIRPDGRESGRSDRQDVPGGQISSAAAGSSGEEVMTAVEMSSEVEKEQKRMHELEALVLQEQKKVDKLQATQRVLENNMSRLYEAAKDQMQEKTKLLSAARLELQRELEVRRSSFD